MSQRRGGHMGERMEREPLGRDSGQAYFTMIADALDHAHSLGVVHRDLKPQNVLLGERGITGTVEVQLTVRRDGSVADVRVLQSRPRGTFERSVLATVRQWRFQPLDEDVTIVRTINFR